MKKFILILKGIMLWVTAFMIMFFVMGIDGLYDKGYIIQSLIDIIIMCYCCYKLITIEEFKKITFHNILDIDNE